MRTVNATVEATVFVPVRVRMDVTINADDNASIPKTMKSWATGKRYAKADIETIDVDHVHEIGTFDVHNQHDRGSTFDDVMAEDLEYGGTAKMPFKIHKITVTDSK